MECEIIFIPWDRAEKYGHSDGIIKPISDNSILMTNYHDFDKAYSNEVINRLSDKFDIKLLSYNIGKTAPESWAYINFLTIGNLIVLPALGKEEDEQALEQIKAYYPNYTIEQLNIYDLVKEWRWSQTIESSLEQVERLTGRKIKLLAGDAYNFKRAMKALWCMIHKICEILFLNNVSQKWAF